MTTLKFIWDLIKAWQALMDFWKELKGWQEATRLKEQEIRRQARAEAIERLKKAESDDEIFDAQEKLVKSKPRP